MYTSLKPVLKDLMKQKGLSYKELGLRIGISESGVKKLFQAEDCSLSRLERIARALELDLPSLMIHARGETPTQVVEIDAKRQAILQKNPLLNDVYWLVLVEGLSPDEILERYKIPKASLYKCLRDLDRLKLIVWKPGDNVMAAPKGPFLVRSRGPLLREWLRRFSQSIIDEFIAQAGDAVPPEKRPYLAQRFLYLRPDSVNEFRQRLSELMNEFSLRSARERSLGKGRVTSVKISAAFTFGSFVKAIRQ